MKHGLTISVTLKDDEPMKIKIYQWLAMDDEFTVHYTLFSIYQSLFGCVTIENEIYSVEITHSLNNKKLTENAAYSKQLCLKWAHYTAL